jgi:uncharacterized protein YhfF
VKRVEIPAGVRPFWDTFVAATGHDPAARFYEAFHFHDEPRVSDALAELVRSGKKLATASLLWTHEAEHRPPPQQGDLSVVTRWSGEPVCVIETTHVDVRAFEDVSGEFAAAEGEGDGSLAYWRDAHWPYFTRECQRIGLAPDVRMPVICERFAVVYSGGPEMAPTPPNARRAPA